MEFIPYSCQNIDADDIAAVVAALSSEYLTQGPAVEAFEAAFAQHHQVAYATSVANATAGLHIACLALNVGPGSRVWTTPNSFLASANCALYCGAAIDFVDIDSRSRNLSVAALESKLLAAQSAGVLPNVLIPVDFAGLPCDLREMRALADHYGFSIIEDASHATGAQYLGKPCGSAWADLSVFSFHAVKILTTGEGGMVTTQDAALARKLELLRSHGMTRVANETQQPPPGGWYYEQQLLGYNYRMTDIQAALGSSQLRRIEAMQAGRIRLADNYDRLLADMPLHLPLRQDDRLSSWHLYAIEVDAFRTAITRGRVFEALRQAQIGVNVHYIPIHTQPFYQAMGFRPGDFPVAEQYYASTLSLPLFPAMTQQQQERVAQVLRQALS